MPDEPNPRAVAGHNAPPADPVVPSRIDEVIAASNAWLTKLPVEKNAAGKDIPVIRDEDTANACRDHITQIELELKALPGDCHDARREHDDLAAPHIAAAQKIQWEFDRAEAKLTLAKRLLKGYTEKKIHYPGVIQTWLDFLEKRQAEERRKTEAAAAAARAEAQEAARLAEQAKGDVIGAKIAAQEAERRANEAAYEAGRAARAKVNVSGENSARALPQRTYYSATVTDHRQTVRHYRDHPKMLALMQELADADARAMKEGFDVPGCDIKIERMAA